MGRKQSTSIRALRIKQDSAGDGLIHYEGSAHCMFETACGHCDTPHTYTFTDEPVNCRGCISVARMFEPIDTEAA